jgi:hypothetical protein
MTTRRAAGIFAALMVGGACASDREAAVVAAPVPVVARPALLPDRVIVRLVSRRHTVTVLAGQRGSLYSVSDPAGRELVSRVTLEELRVRNPDAYRLVQPGATAFAGIGSLD